MTTNEVANLIRAIPTMGENVKIEGKTSRINVLFLNAVIMAGLGKKEEGATAALLENLSKEAIQEILNLAQEFLQKAGLNELNDALKNVVKK